MPSVHGSSREVLSSFLLLKGLDTEPARLWIDYIADQESRYRIWAGNIGAYHNEEDTRSADIKLRNSRQVSRRILQALDEILETNNDLLEILSGAREGYTEDVADDGTDTNEPRSEVKELLLGIDDLIRTLLKTSVLIRSSRTRNRAAYTKSACGRLPSSFDIDHVLHKFPKLQGNDQLVRKLGKAITQRREFLMYSRDHHHRIARDPLDGEDLNLGNLKQPGSGLSARMKGSELGTEHTRVTLALTTNTSVYSTDLDPAVLGHLEDYEGDDTASQASTFMSSTDRDDNALLNVVQMSSLGEYGEPFKCPYCCGMVMFKRQSAWRQHVLADLRAYVCTTTSCTADMFDSRSAWENHEQSLHRRTWKCPECPSLIMPDRIHLAEHLEDKHLGVKTNTLQSAADAASPYLQLMSPSDCSFCEEWSHVLRTERQLRDRTDYKEPLTVTMKQFLRYVSRHLEQLALFAIGPNVSEASGEIASMDKRSFEAKDADSDSRHSDGPSDEPDLVFNNDSRTSRPSPPLVDLKRSDAGSTQGSGQNYPPSLAESRDAVEENVPDSSASETWSEIDEGDLTDDSEGSMKMLSSVVDPSCAICGAPPYPECPHEGEQLKLALHQAFEKAQLPDDQEAQKFVLDNSRHQMLTKFAHLRSMRMAAHSNHLQSIPYYTLYHRYKGKPPLESVQLELVHSQIQQANQILQQGVDQDWKTSLLQCSSVLDDYCGMVEVLTQQDGSKTVKFPKLFDPATQNSIFEPMTGPIMSTVQVGSPNSSPPSPYNALSTTNLDQSNVAEHRDLSSQAEEDLIKQWPLMREEAQIDTSGSLVRAPAGGDAHLYQEPKMFACDQCQKTCKREIDLKRHRATIHGAGLLLRCDSCPYTTARKDKIREHCWRRHGQQIGLELYSPSENPPRNAERQ